MMKSHNRIHIGTSGWHYNHWKGHWYPASLPADRFLEYYAERFRTVEINNSFYRMPERKALIHWREATPRSFLFAVKASRYITHMKKLKDVRKPLADFLRRVGVLDDKLGPILFQLPPRWKVNVDRLRAFLSLLPQDRRFAFEFRDQSWFTQEVYDALSDAGAAFCIYQFAGFLSPRKVTADFVYLRLHGPEREAYRGAYSDRTLNEWANEIAVWSATGREIFCYFDNDEKGYAAQNALKLQFLMQG